MSGTGSITLSNPAARIGRWWFKNRSLSPVPLFLLLVLLPPNFRPSALGFSLALIGVLLAEGLRLWAVGYAGSVTRTRGETVPQLVHAGPYRWVRNPLYIANIAMYTLAGVLFGFSYLSAFIFLYSCVQYTFIVRFEEEILVRTFGEPYRNYVANVPRWFPGTAPVYPTSGHAFNLKAAFVSERSTLYSLSAMALLYVAKIYLTA